MIVGPHRQGAREGPLRSVELVQFGVREAELHVVPEEFGSLLDADRQGVLGRQPVFRPSLLSSAGELEIAERTQVTRPEVAWGCLQSLVEGLRRVEIIMRLVEGMPGQEQVRGG